MRRRKKHESTVSKPVVYELVWQHCRWELRMDRRVVRAYGPHKDKAEYFARRFCSMRWEALAERCVLRIKNRDGRIGRGGRSEASYGCDSRRRRG